MNSRLIVLAVVTSLVGVIHIVSGLGVIWTPEAALVSSLAGLSRITKVADPILGFALVGIGLMAIYSARVTELPWKLMLLVPQQMVLILQLISILVTFNLGTYPDGYIPMGDRCPPLLYWGSCFILADQSPWLVLSLIHTAIVAEFSFLPGRYIDDAEVVRACSKRDRGEGEPRSCEQSDSAAVLR